RKECMDGLTLGHYCGNDYAAAKRDFATRTGLVPEEKQLTTEQLIEIYHCCADAIQRDYGLTYEREQCIEEVQSQITELLPDYEERLKRRWSRMLPNSPPCKNDRMTSAGVLEIRLRCFFDF
ncbi:MAG: hypothetical protein RR867_09280, partial [Ruthenibacterium sp.]